MLIAHGGLLEATDARGRMAASFLTPPLVQRLLVRVNKPAPAPAPDDDSDEEAEAALNLQCD